MFIFVRVQACIIILDNYFVSERYGGFKMTWKDFEMIFSIYDLISLTANFYRHQSSIYNQCTCLFPGVTPLLATWTSYVLQPVCFMTLQVKRYTCRMPSRTLTSFRTQEYLNIFLGTINEQHVR